MGRNSFLDALLGLQTASINDFDFQIGSDYMNYIAQE